MKKILFILSTMVLLNTYLVAQTTTPTPSTTPSTPTVDKEDVKQKDFDKKYRFGLRVAPQPTWLKSGNTNETGNGAYFGFGFGLMMEIKLSDIIHFSTGIGGDLEGGTISYRNDNTFNVNTVIDNQSNMVEAKNGISKNQYDQVNGNSQFIMNERKYKATFVTIPLLLKMMTQEYSGMKYFMNFGLEVAVRAGIKADDTYASGVKTTVTGTSTTSSIITDASQLKISNINVSKDASLIPMRVGLNVGLGTEYRLGGTTSFVTSINYFQSFTNLMANNSKYLTNGDNNTYTSAGGYSFAALSQSLIMRAIRINIGILF